MKIIIIQIILLIATLSSSQSKAIFNQTEFDYKGDVESVLIEEFEPRFKKDEIVGYRYGESFLGVGSQKLFFDSDGKVIKKFEYETSCGGDSIQLDKIWNYYYTGAKLDSVIRSEADTSLIRKGFRPWKFYYKYDSDSVYYETHNLSFTRTSKITKTENKRIREYLTKDSTVLLIEISTYDTLQRQVKFESFINKELTTIIIYNYADDNSKTANLSYSIDLKDNKVRRNEHQFNNNGDITKTTLFKSNGEYLTHWTFKYEYDELNNWVRNEQYNYEDRMINMYRQKIKYRTSR